MAFLAPCVFSSRTRKDECFVLSCHTGSRIWVKMAVFFFSPREEYKEEKENKTNKTKTRPRQAASLLLDGGLCPALFLLSHRPWERCSFHLAISLSQSHTAFALSPEHICQRLFWRGFRGDVFHVMAYLGLVEFYFFSKSSSGAVSVEQSDLTEPSYIIRLFRDANWKAFAARF